MRRILLTATTAVVAGGLGLSATASAAPLLPSTPTLPSVGGLVGTDAQCESGLVSVSLGGTTVCVLPDAPATPQATSCAPGTIAVEIAGQGVVCVAADPTAIEVLPTNPDGSAQCRDGLVPVQIAGGSIGCLLATVAGDAGADGSNGANGTNGATGARGTSGANGTSSSTTTGSTTSGSGSSAAGSSSTPGTTGARVAKPTLTLRRTLRGASRAVVRSSTKRVVVTTLGRRHGRTVRFTRQLSLKRTGAATSARPYTGALRIVPKTTGALRIRITSRAAGQVRTATFKRTVARR